MAAPRSLCTEACNLQATRQAEKIRHSQNERLYNYKNCTQDIVSSMGRNMMRRLNSQSQNEKCLYEHGIKASWREDYGEKGEMVDGASGEKEEMDI